MPTTIPALTDDSTLRNVLMDSMLIDVPPLPPVIRCNTTECVKKDTLNT